MCTHISVDAVSNHRGPIGWLVPAASGTVHSVKNMEDRKDREDTEDTGLVKQNAISINILMIMAEKRQHS